MDTYDIFRKITYGTQFKRNRNRKSSNNSLIKLGGEEKRSKQLAAEPLNLGVSTEKPVLSDELKLESEAGNHDSNIHENSKFMLFAKTMGSPPVGLKKKVKMTKAKLARIKQEQITHFRRSNQIYVYGSDIPDPIENFEQLHTDYGLSSLVLNNIANLGYSTPTPIQMQAIPLLLHNRQILACAPTGSGKTAAFLIPLIHLLKGPKKFGIRALIVSPTRELAKQISRECIRLSEDTSLRVHVIDKVKITARKLEPNSSKKIDILISTPNRLIYMLQQDPPAINLERVEWLIIDESDKLFEDGKQGFRDQLAVIYKACNYVNIKRAMFSATFSHDVEEWCKLNLDDLATLSVGIRNAAVETVQQSLLFVGNESGKLLAFRDLVKKGLSPPVLVFVQSKERAKELFNELVYDGINVDVIHADRTQLQRDNVVRSFRSGHIWVLICTEIMGRGIDFKGVNLVINYDFPPSAISYIHRIGRTGRAGRTGCALTYFTEDDRENLRSIAQVMKNAGCDVPDYMLRLKKKSKQKNEVSRPIKRIKISTVPEYDIEKKANLKKFIQNSKRRGSRKKKSFVKGGKKSLL